MGIGWLLTLENRLGRKIDRSELATAVETINKQIESSDAKVEKKVDERHGQNGERLDKQDLSLNQIRRTLLVHALKAKHYRHSTKSNLQAINNKLTILLAGGRVSLPLQKEEPDEDFSSDEDEELEEDDEDHRET